MLSSPSKMSLLGIHLVHGSDCREGGSRQMLVSEQKVAGRGRQDSFSCLDFSGIPGITVAGNGCLDASHSLSCSWELSQCFL